LREGTSIRDLRRSEGWAAHPLGVRDLAKTVAMKRPQGRLDFEYEVDEKVEQNVTAWGGLPFVGEIMSATGVDAAIKEHREAPAWAPRVR
jgi:hypothetical protein